MLYGLTDIQNRTQDRIKGEFRAPPFFLPGLNTCRTALGISQSQCEYTYKVFCLRSDF